MRTRFNRKTWSARRGRRRGARLRGRGLKKPAGLVHGARARLNGFRQATILAVALTGLLLLILAPGDSGVADPAAVQGLATQSPLEPTTQTPPTPPDSQTAQTPPADDSNSADPAEEVEPLPQAAHELNSAVRNLWNGFLINLPKFLVAAAIIVTAWLLSRILRMLITRLSSRWERGKAISVLVMAGFWLVAFGIAISILAGDLRALVGSLGLVGLALSWALQTPIESFTGWLLNSFRGYYRIGDRIAVGDIFGDVYNIDVLTTTIWEIGGPDRPPGQVHAEQPTGRLITFPNNEILTGSVVNLTRDFPFVWDELQVPVANESDLSYAFGVMEKVAADLLEKDMQEPARLYQAILQAAGLASSIPDRPKLFFSMEDSWVTITIRYLVPARQRRSWKSELTLRVMDELRRPEHTGKIIPAYHRRQVQFIDDAGRPQIS